MSCRTPSSSVGHLEPEQPVRRLVPRVRQVLDREPALDQRELELEAQRDVQVVGRLVGLDPDQAQPDLVDARGRARRRPSPRTARRGARAAAAAPTRRTAASGRRGSPTAGSGTRGRRARPPRRASCGSGAGPSAPRRARARTRAGRSRTPSRGRPPPSASSAARRCGPCCARTGAPTASRRQCSGSKPTAASTRRRARCCADRGSGPGRRARPRPAAAAAETSGTSSCCRRRTASRSSAVVRPRLVVVEQDVVRVRELAGAVEARRCSGCCSSSTRSSAGAEAREVATSRAPPSRPAARARRRWRSPPRGRSGRCTALWWSRRERGDEPRRRRSPGRPTPPTARARPAARRAPGSVRRSCWIRSSASNWSARAPAPPGGIIVFWSHRSRPPIPPRSAISPARSRSFASSFGASLIVTRPGDVVEQRVQVGEREVLGQVARGLLARLPPSAMLSAISRAPASSAR